MRNIVLKIYNFMKNRNGADELYYFLFFIILFLGIINYFISNEYVSFVESLLIIFMIYRFFSKDIYRRRKENNYYLGIKKRIISNFDLIKKRWNDRNTYIYRKCPKCKKIHRLPLKKGVHTCKCLRCGNKFKVRCFRSEKIRVEVIKNKK